MVKALKVTKENIDIINQIRFEYNKRLYRSPLKKDYNFVTISEHNNGLVGTTEWDLEMTLEELLEMYNLNKTRTYELW